MRPRDISCQPHTPTHPFRYRFPAYNPRGSITGRVQWVLIFVAGTHHHNREQQFGFDVPVVYQASESLQLIQTVQRIQPRLSVQVVIAIHERRGATLPFRQVFKLAPFLQLSCCLVGQSVGSSRRS